MRSIAGYVRVPLHGYRTIHRSICAQRRLCFARQSAGDRDVDVVRRCRRSLQSDPAFLEILVSFCRPSWHQRKSIQNQ